MISTTSSTQIQPYESPYACVRNAHALKQYSHYIDKIADVYKRFQDQCKTWQTLAPLEVANWTENNKVAKKEDFELHFKIFIGFLKEIKIITPLLKKTITLMQDAIEFARAEEKETISPLVWKRLEKAQCPIADVTKTIQKCLVEEPTHLQKLLDEGEDDKPGLLQIESDLAALESKARRDLELWCTRADEKPGKYLLMARDTLNCILGSTTHIDRRIERALKETTQTTE